MSETFLLLVLGLLFVILAFFLSHYAMYRLMVESFEPYVVLGLFSFECLGLGLLCFIAMRGTLSKPRAKT